MVIVESIELGDVFRGQELEYFVDDDLMIGEVYLDGNLIYQSVDVISDEQLGKEFRSEYRVETEEYDSTVLDF